MPRFDANIDLLFTERPFLSRFQATADAGMDAVEILNPYPHGAPAIQEAAGAAGTEIVLINTPVLNPEAGIIGCAAAPARRDTFESSVIAALDMASAIGAQRIHVMVGNGDPDSQAANDCVVANFRQAAVEARTRNVTLMLEPLNLVDRPGYFLSTNAHACRLLDRIAAENVQLQFDAYHTQIMTGDLTRAFRGLRERTGHIQIANPPDRHEPGHGEVDFSWFLSMVDDQGYDGPVGLEYMPSGTTEASLQWFRLNGFL
ncbi:MAG: TIM barrel protein [Minwuia sp.]|nr:TIM barrel protein [Minwuia sp.]